MRKLFTLLYSLLVMMQLATAQHNLYVLTRDSVLQFHTAITKVFFDDSPFVFEYGDVTEVTKSSFSASLTVSFKSAEIKTVSQVLEVGICFSDLNTTPTLQDSKFLLDLGVPANYTTYNYIYPFTLKGLDAGTTYYYRAYVKVGEAVVYGDVCQETTFGKKTTSE